MKKPMIYALILCCGLTYAQNKNITEKSKVTVTTVKDSDGERKSVKETKTKEQQDVEFKDADGSALNKDLKATPISVETQTTITNPDGSTRTVNIDRSGYYDNNGVRYRLSLDAQGYTLNNERDKPAMLRRTSTNAFIYKHNGNVSVAYFDSSGNLVVDEYDQNADRVQTVTYARLRE